MTCQPIEGTDVREGDRVRVTSVLTGTVTKVTDYGAKIKPAPNSAGFCDEFSVPFSSPQGYEDHEKRWELLDRPRPFGSLWRDPESGTEWVVTAGTNDNRLVCVRTAPESKGYRIGMTAASDSAIGRQLVRVESA